MGGWKDGAEGGSVWYQGDLAEEGTFQQYRGKEKGEGFGVAGNGDAQSLGHDNVVPTASFCEQVPVPLCTPGRPSRLGPRLRCQGAVVSTTEKPS